MERVTKDQFKRTSLQQEHFHRYQIAALVSAGFVADCACGIGYGAEILTANPNVECYFGIDPSPETIQYACETYGAPGVEFETGTLEANSRPPKSIDTFIMLETLEHTANPAACLESVRSRLKDGGLLVGSVPSAEYEARCEETYGPNPYHLQRFIKSDLKGLLLDRFESVQFFAAEFLVGTLLRPLKEDGGAVADCLSAIGDLPWSTEEVLGSFIFFAGGTARVRQAVSQLHRPMIFYPGLSKVKLDEEEVETVRRVLSKTEENYADVHAALSFAESMAAERWTIMQSMEAMISARDEMLASQHRVMDEHKSMIADVHAALSFAESMAAERWTIMQSMEAMISARDEMLASQHRVMDEHKSMIAVLARNLGPANSLKSLLATDQKTVPFRDLAFALYLFAMRLHEIAKTQQICDLFFFSREGFLLKDMFDQVRARTKSPAAIRTHYLQVSRRSTFLPSLGPIEEERFEVLFRQYRRISLNAFLASLALEQHGPQIASAMGVGIDVLNQVREDLPTDPLFRQLIELTVFREIYRREQTERSVALAGYIASFADGFVPETMHIVDVGWKGSIQDNLFNWLARQKGEDACVDGYYIGLVAPGGRNVRNRKTGLLFSNQLGVTPGFHIFNENRALFEVLLPAHHGSPRAYTLDADGSALVMHDAFVEQDLIEARVTPVIRGILICFRQIVELLAIAPLPPDQLFALVCERHRRMVFRPTEAEIEWINSVFHVENFGVFEESRFETRPEISSFLNRARFTWNLIRRRRPSEVGFWPYLTLRDNALSGTSALYRGFRYLQEYKYQ